MKRLFSIQRCALQGCLYPEYLSYILCPSSDEFVLEWSKLPQGGFSTLVISSLCSHQKAALNCDTLTFITDCTKLSAC